MPSLRQQVFIFLKNNPNAKNPDLYEKFKGESHNSLRTYKNQFFNSQSQLDISPITKQSKPQFIPPQIEYTDDPDELLLSVAIRELNKPDPDPRWASILINCKKEKITTKGAAFEQFKNLPTQALVNLLSKNSQEEL